MKYKFVKLQDKKLDSLKYPWMLECSDIKTLEQHNIKYMHSEIKKGIKNYFETNLPKSGGFLSIRSCGHYTSHWENAITLIGEVKGTNPLFESQTLEYQVLNGKIKSLLQYGSIYLNENGSYMINSGSFKIIEEIIKENILYPTYSINDISVTKWEGGKHFYVKIGNMDVVEDDGTRKWSNYKLAYNKALEYFNKINK